MITSRDADVSTLSKASKFFEAVRVSASKFSRLLIVGVGLVLLQKIEWANDASLTLREDPLEMWIGLAVAVLAIHVGLHMSSGDSAK